jgi:hypothetical protein
LFQVGSHESLRLVSTFEPNFLVFFSFFEEEEEEVEYWFPSFQDEESHTHTHTLSMFCPNLLKFQRSRKSIQF